MQIQKFNSEQDLKVMLATHYQNQINNYFGDNKKALKFLSGVVASVQRNPKLLECNPTSVINSFMTMASLEFMPSDVSGEAYVLPYKNQAQFQLGYQGLVTLFYRAGAKSIIAEIVYEKDKFDYTNGIINHTIDPFDDNRGEVKGAYVIVELQAGGKIAKAMSKKKILDIGKKFSKSFNSEYSPWKEKNDPDLWMFKKTVLKQVAKLVPKNETIYKAIDEDNKDSNIEERKRDILPKIEISVSDYSDKLSEATDVETLKTIWDKFPQSAQNDEKLIAKKDEMKKFFEKPTKTDEELKVEPISENREPKGPSKKQKEALQEFSEREGLNEIESPFDKDKK